MHLKDEYALFLPLHYHFNRRSLDFFLSVQTIGGDEVSIFWYDRNGQLNGTITMSWGLSTCTIADAEILMCVMLTSGYGECFQLRNLCTYSLASKQIRWTHIESVAGQIDSLAKPLPCNDYGKCPVEYKHGAERNSGGTYGVLCSVSSQHNSVSFHQNYAWWIWSIRWNSLENGK